MWIKEWWNTEAENWIKNYILLVLLLSKVQLNQENLNLSPLYIFFVFRVSFCNLKLVIARQQRLRYKDLWLIQTVHKGEKIRKFIYNLILVCMKQYLRCYFSVKYQSVFSIWISIKVKRNNLKIGGKVLHRPHTRARRLLPKHHNLPHAHMAVSQEPLIITFIHTRSTALHPLLLENLHPSIKVGDIVINYFQVLWELLLYTCK